MLIPDPSASLALTIAEAIERWRNFLIGKARQNGTVPPAGLAEIRDAFLAVATGRQQSSSWTDWAAVAESAFVQPRLFTREQTATALACSVTTVDRLIKSCGLPAVKLGDGSVRIRVADLDTFVDGCKPTRSGGAAA